MAIIKALPNRSDWYGLQGGCGVASRLADNFSVVPPDSRWNRSIRIEQQDGCLSPWQSDAEATMASSGNDLGWWKYNTVRWTEFWLRIDQIGSLNGWWCFITETHLPSGGTQAPWAIDMSSGQIKFRHWVGPTTWPTVDSPGVPLDPGVWHHYRIGQFMTINSNGWYEFWRDDTRIYRFDGRTNATAEDLFGAIGWYRNINQNGTALGYIAGYVIHDTNPGYPGSTPPPPPPIVITAPTSVTAGTPSGQSVTVTAVAANTDTNRTGVAIYRKATPWTTGQSPSSGTEVAYQVGTSNPTTAIVTESLAFGTYYYAAFSVNKTLNTHSTFVTTGAVTITAPPSTEVTYNHSEQNVPNGTWYYAVLNSNSGGDTERLAASAVTIGTVAQAPLEATSLTATYISGGDILISLNNPSDANRTTAQIWRKTTAWTNNDTSGATSVATVNGSSATQQSFTDINLNSGTYYYAVLNTGDGGTVRRTALAVTVTSEPPVDTLNYSWPGGAGVVVPVDTWTVTGSNVSGGSSVTTQGNNTARIRIAKAGGTDAYYNIEHKVQYDLDYTPEEDARLFYFEHGHPSLGSEIGVYLTPQTDLTNVLTASKLIYVKYSTLSNANGTFEVGFKSESGQTAGTFVPMATLATGAGTTTSSIVYYIMIVGSTLKVAVRDRLGATHILSLNPTNHPFIASDLDRINSYIRAYTTSTSNADIILNRIMLFENQGEALSNPSITPLKANDTVWTPGEATELWTKTRFNATLIPNDPSLPTEYVVEVDDVELSPPASTLPVVYASTFSFDVNHRIEIYSRNRSPFPPTLTPGGDTDAPVLTVDGPNSGSAFSGTQNFTATATSPSGIREVRWYVDSRVRRIDQIAPYTYSLDTSLFQSGNHTFQVVAIGNNDKTSTVVRPYSFGVASPPADVTGPVFVFTGPVDGTIIDSNYTVFVSPDDPTGIEKVEFIVDGQVRARATTPSYVFIIDPFAYTDGSHVFTIKVYDYNGNVTTENRNITIDQPVIVNPSAILGDSSFVEPGLRGRSDIIWFGSFNASPWYDTFYLEEAPTNLGNQTITTGNSLDGKCLSVRYPGGNTVCTQSPRFVNGGGTTPGGFKAFMDISDTGTPDQEELFIRYYVRFQPGFSWVGGGALPGLAGGTRPLDCGDYDDEGWSGMHRWGPNGRVGVKLFVNRIGTSLMNNCGLQRHFTVNGQQTGLLKPGTWHCIEARYVMNTPGVDNGIYQGWFDGEPALEMTKVRYRDTGETFKIDTFIIGTYFDGSACNWWPKTAQYCRFDNFVIGKNRIGLR